MYNRYLPNSQIVARQVFTVLSLSCGPSFAIEIITCRSEGGNLDGATSNIFLISLSAWILSMSLSRHKSNDLQIQDINECDIKFTFNHEVKLSLFSSYKWWAWLWVLKLLTSLPCYQVIHLQFQQYFHSSLIESKISQCSQARCTNFFGIMEESDT